MMRLAVPLAILLAGWPVAAFAHHGIINFDMNREIDVSGVVTRLAFVNPHSWLYSMSPARTDGSTAGNASFAAPPCSAAPDGRRRCSRVARASGLPARRIGSSRTRVISARRVRERNPYRSIRSDHPSSACHANRGSERGRNDCRTAGRISPVIGPRNNACSPIRAASAARSCR